MNNKNLLPITQKNITEFLQNTTNELYKKTIDELIKKEKWEELNDRFFKKLSFGTGGLRSRTIGKFVTDIEKGNAKEHEKPQHPCIGYNAMNFFNISRATQGLVNYLKKITDTPKIAVAHDTRNYSPEFTNYFAKIASYLGCEVYLFNGARSTPQLSFTVRYLKCHAGAVFTASHNPYHDNGFKVYFSDGAQIIEPHASGIIAEVNKIQNEKYEKTKEGKIFTINEKCENEYLKTLDKLVLEKNVFKEKSKVVFTNLHGTGGVHIPNILTKYNFDVHTVLEQDTQDGFFTTVKSPNPENPEALDLAIKLCKKENINLIIGTDPDADRLACASPDKNGNIQVINGNQLGAMLTRYRLETLINKKILTTKTTKNATIISTVVSSDLIKTITEKLGAKYIETLTGFKYIAAKLALYEKEDLKNLDFEEKRKVMLENYSYFVFGCEESFGYLGQDEIRDKDANGSALMLAELFASLKNKNISLIDYLNETYCKFGYFHEKLHSIVREGAKGAQEISELIKSYIKNPPKEIDGSPVNSFQDFSNQDIIDKDGETLPKEKMIVCELKDGRKIAIRPSGTEPKIKFYLMSKNLPQKNTHFSEDQLNDIKTVSNTKLNKLWEWITEDVHKRLS